MRNTLRHTVTLLLTFCILLGSFGVALSEQLCLMTGIKTAAAQEQMDGCCKKPAPAAESEDSCCTVEVSFEKLEPVSSLKSFTLEAPVFFAVALKPFVAFRAPAILTDNRILTYSDSSPPLYGRSLLHRIHILII